SIPAGRAFHDHGADSRALNGMVAAGGAAGGASSRVLPAVGATPCARGERHPSRPPTGELAGPLRLRGSRALLSLRSAQPSGGTQLVTSAAGRPEEARAEIRLYEQLSGRELSKIEVFEVAACMRQLLSALISLRFGAARQGMRPEATALMRRDTGHIRHVAVLLQERTGIKMPDLDDSLLA